MAVVIMRMVEADRAGVMFTSDPQGRPTDVRIELVEGLAEDLVGGHATPHVVVVPRQGSRRVPSDVAWLVDHLLDLSTEAEKRFGRPQDIEWAARGAYVFLVQSRPITTSAAPDDHGFDTVVDDNASYTTVGVAEMLPGVLPPLIWSVYSPMLQEGFRHLFDSLGVPVPQDEPVVVRVRGRAALNLDMLRSAARSTGGSAAELEVQYFGESLTHESRDELGTGPGAFGVLAASLRAARLRHALGRESAVVQAAIDRVVELGVPIDELSPVDLLAYREQAHDLAARAVVAQVAVGVAAAASFRALELFLERYVGEGPAQALSLELTAGEVGAAGGGAALDLDRALAPFDTGWLRSVVDAPRPRIADLEQELPGTSDGRRLLAALRVAARRAGSRAVFGGRTWDEAMDEVWEALQARVHGSMVTGPPKRAGHDQLHEVEQRLASKGRRWLTRILTGQLVDVRRRIMRRLVEDAVRFLAHREHIKLAALRLGGESRRTSRRAAALLCQAEILGDETDVEFLTDTELRRALQGRWRPGRRVTGRRRGLDRARRSRDLPRVFAGRPVPAAEPIPDAASGQHLEGWAASSGQHRGRPRVISHPGSSRLEDGDVLVAHSTDPSWTPLFLQAGAIVVEEGGPLSHAAIVARELGVPAVLNVPGAADGLANVASVTVDGSHGVVIVHGRGDRDEAPGKEASA